MKPQPKELYEKFRKFFEEVCPQLQACENYVKTERDITHAADAAYALKEVKRIVDQVWSDVNRIDELSQKITCMLYLTIDVNDGGPIRTSLCTATPDVKIIASLPKKKTEPIEFAAMMRFLGIEEELWNSEDKEDEAVRVHWPGMMNLLSRRMQEGRPLPPGVDPNKTYPHYKLSVRAKKGATPSGIPAAECNNTPF